MTATMGELRMLADALAKGEHRLAVDTIPQFHWPYGLWSWRAGSAALFNRSYLALWHRRGDGKIVMFDPPIGLDADHEQILFDDWPPLHRQYANMKMLRAVLVDWGLIYERGQRWRQYQAKRERRRQQQEN